MALSGSVRLLRRRALPGGSRLPGRLVWENASLLPQRPRDAVREAGEVVAGRLGEQRGLDEQGEIAVAVA